jgi:hypothetical protein
MLLLWHKKSPEQIAQDFFCGIAFQLNSSSVFSEYRQRKF